MIKISLCMIVKNESETLARCLDSVKNAVDEIIIVDTGSTDNTKDIAKNFTSKVYDFEWIDDFSAARNFAFSFAENEFIMWLDADDIIKKSSLEKLISLKQTLTSDIDIVYMNYDICFDENGNSVYSYFRERLVRKSKKPIWIEPVHEVISIDGKALYSDISIEHRKLRQNPPGRNLKIFENALANKKILSPRLQFYYARELMFNKLYEKAIDIFENYLEKNQGWFENNITACRDLSFCYEEIGNKQKAYDSALQGLKYSLPRSEILCRIGELFLNDNSFKEAEFWYLQAINQGIPKDSLGFLEEDYYGYIPALQLCVIYYYLGKYNKAEEYNDIAGKYKPLSKAYLHNKKIFNTKKDEVKL